MTQNKELKREFYEAEIKIELDNQWLALTASRNEQGNKDETISSPFLSDKLNLTLAIDSDGSRRMLLPFSDTEVFKQDKKSATVQVIKSSYDFSGSKKNYVDVKLLNPDKATITYNKFNTFCSQVIGKIVFENKSNYVSSKEALQEAREFLKGDKETLLSSEEIKGLIGEMLVLREIISKNPNSFEGWHGPDAMRHDFRRNNISIEVKSTSLKDSKKCKINGHDQLEKPENTELFFSYFQFEQDDQGLSIPVLIQELEKKGVARVDLEKKLNDVGFDFEKWNKYNESSRRYRLINNFHYIVDENFPKLTSASFPEKRLPVNVVDITYQINLEGVKELDITLVNEMIESFCKE
tara:strand:+ start:326 stop:1381 length:1056 start_codon:yes stop_codon:yes gene_type:complete